MKQPVLFDIPRDRPAHQAKADIKAFKAEHKIWTHSMPGEQSEAKWIAMFLPKNPHGKLPYEDCFKSDDPWEIFAGYCRVLEESGFLVDAATEREAIRTLCDGLGIPCDL